MAEKRYMISDASKQVDVEAHVLRYWEDELSLEIPRNEMGHRYYTEENITLLKNIKLLKEKGFQLKAIKMILPDLIRTGGANLDAVLVLKDELNKKVMEEENNSMLQPISTVNTQSQVALRQNDPEPTPAPAPSPAPSPSETIHISDQKLQQFQLIMTSIISQALAEHTATLGQDLSNRVSDNIIKEMDYLIRTQDDRDEERFKRLDETIRTYQKNRHEAAASIEEGREEGHKKRKKGLFRRR